jgi:magnesium transporter
MGRSVLKVHVHTSNGHLSEKIALSAISDVVQRKDELLWIDAVDPSDDDLRLLQEEFGFHPLAMEDVAQQHRQRPKVDLYEGYIFLVFYCLDHYERGKRLSARQVSFFVGSNYVVTLHDGEVRIFEEIKRRWEQNSQAISSHDAGILTYTILDAIVDDYFPLIDDLSEEVEALEEVLFGKFDRDTQQRLFQLKKELFSIRRVVAPERDVLNVLVRRDTPIFSETAIIYFQDVYDHIIRVTEAIDMYRDLMSSALDSFLSITSNRLNEVMKTLTGWSIILMTIAAISGFYGMNYRHIPTLSWHYGYLWALLLMIGFSIGLYFLFRRRGYF